MGCKSWCQVKQRLSKQWYCWELDAQTLMEDLFIQQGDFSRKPWSHAHAIWIIVGLFMIIMYIIFYISIDLLKVCHLHYRFPFSSLQYCGYKKKGRHAYHNYLDITAKKTDPLNHALTTKTLIVDSPGSWPSVEGHKMVFTYGASNSNLSNTHCQVVGNKRLTQSHKLTWRHYA